MTPGSVHFIRLSVFIYVWEAFYETIQKKDDSQFLCGGQEIPKVIQLSFWVKS